MTEKKLWRSGFTLIELLAVVAIIGILATIAVIGISTATKKARDASRKTDIQNLKQAIELYGQDNNNTYPKSKDYATLLTDLAPYMKNPPHDPRFGKTTGWPDYQYAVNATAQTYDKYVIYAQLEDTGAKADLALDCGKGQTALSPASSGNGVAKASSASKSYPCFRLATD